MKQRFFLPVAFRVLTSGVLAVGLMTGQAQAIGAQNLAADEWSAITTGGDIRYDVTATGTRIGSSNARLEMGGPGRLFVIASVSSGWWAASRVYAPSSSDVVGASSSHSPWTA